MSKADRTYMEGGASYRVGRVRLRQLRVKRGELRLGILCVCC